MYNCLLQTIKMVLALSKQFLRWNEDYDELERLFKSNYSFKKNSVETVPVQVVNVQGVRLESGSERKLLSISLKVQTGNCMAFC